MIYFQTMNPAVSRHGHAYVCRICLAEGSSVVDRKGRMISHIMKQHIPLDEVPFYCSLCLFRATDQKSLMAHVQNYSRHVKLARDLGITTDHSIYLHASSKPAKIGDAHMIVLSPEVEMRRPRQLTAVEDPLDSWEDLQSWGGRPHPRPCCQAP